MGAAGNEIEIKFEVQRVNNYFLKMTKKKKKKKNGGRKNGGNAFYISSLARKQKTGYIGFAMNHTSHILASSIRKLSEPISESQEFAKFSTNAYQTCFPICPPSFSCLHRFFLLFSPIGRTRPFTALYL